MKKIKNLYEVHSEEICNLFEDGEYEVYEELPSEEIVMEIAKLNEEVPKKFYKLGYSQLQTKVFENIVSHALYMKFDIDIDVDFGFTHNSYRIYNLFFRGSYPEYVDPFVEYGEDVLEKGNYLPLLNDIVENINDDLKEEEVKSYMKQKIDDMKKRNVPFKFPTPPGLFETNLDIFED